MYIDPFERAVLEYIQQEQLLESGERVLVAVSGGPDSTALLLCLTRLASILNLELSAAHVNHKLRSRESDEDEVYVRRLCQELLVPLEVAGCDTRQQAQQMRANLEAVARKQRYDFFFDIATARGAIAATGHTLNDQVETFFLKLARGSGPVGLSGIFPLRRNYQLPTPVTVIRPLLERSRDDVFAYLQRRGKPFRMDSSNLDLSLDRNWVRHELIPLLREKLNPELVHVVARTSKLLREIEEFIAREVGKASRLAFFENEDSRGVSIAALELLQPVIQKGIIRKLIYEEKGDLSEITHQHVESILDLAKGESGREIHLPGGLRVRREFEKLCVLTGPQVEQFGYRLPIPGSVYVPELRERVRAEIVPHGEIGNRDPVICVSDAVLTVRNWRPGDRYQISEKGPARKLKKIFNQFRIPWSRRNSLLVFEAAGSIVWVEGLPPVPGRAGTLAVKISIDRETLLQEPTLT